MDRLRTWMFENVYLGPEAQREHSRVATLLQSLFHHFCDHPEELPGAPQAALAETAEAAPRSGTTSLAERVTDHLAGMTDRYCIRVFEDLTIPRSFD